MLGQRRVLGQANSWSRKLFTYNSATMAKKKVRQRPAGMLTDQVFRKWLKSYRERNGLILRELSNRTRIPISRLSDMQRGKMRRVSVYLILLPLRRRLDMLTWLSLSLTLNRTSGRKQDFDVRKN